MNIDRLKTDMLSTVRQYQSAGYYPSAVVSVCTKEGRLFRFAVGDVKENTLFDVASLTKIAASTLALLAIEEGLFSLESRLLDLLPELGEDEGLRNRLDSVTTFQLLTHTSGLPDWFPFYTDGRAFSLVLKAACSEKPESEMIYSDLNFILLGKVLEKIYSLPLKTCLEDKLVKPFELHGMSYKPHISPHIAPSSYGNPIEEKMCRDLGMTFTGWRPHAPLIGEVNDGNAYYYFGGVSGHAGIFSNTDAYEKLLMMYLNTASPLLLSSMQEHAPTRGLGWQVSDMYPEGCGHTGFTGTSLYLSCTLDIGCVIFTNRLFYPHENPNPTHDLRRAMHKLLAQAIHEDRTPEVF